MVTEAIQDSDEDGYEIVVDYRAHLKSIDMEKGSHLSEHLEKELMRNIDNPYCGGIIGKYYQRYPVWAFVEIIPLGSLIHFYEFCAKRLNSKEMLNDFYLLKAIKELRNASAHNNCILNDLSAKDNDKTQNYDLIRELKSISKTTRDKKLKTREFIRSLQHSIHTNGL